MSDENKLEQLLNEFVDDLNAGREPKLYEYLLDNPEDADELLPMMNFVGWYKQATMEVPVSEKEKVRSALLAPWTMRRLVEESKPELLNKAEEAGLSQNQIRQLRNDDTPIDLNKPNDIVGHLSEKYGVRFFNLLGWVRQMISDVMTIDSGNSMSPAFTREDKRRKDDYTADNGDE